MMPGFALASAAGAGSGRCGGRRRQGACRQGGRVPHIVKISCGEQQVVIFCWQHDSDAVGTLRYRPDEQPAIP